MDDCGESSAASGAEVIFALITYSLVIVEMLTRVKRKSSHKSCFTLGLHRGIFARIRADSSDPPSKHFSMMLKGHQHDHTRDIFQVTKVQ